MTFPSSCRTAAAVLVVAGLLAGCAGLVSTSTVTTTRGGTASATGGGGPFARVYTCPDGFRFSVRAGPDEARVDLGTRVVVLTREVSASGARYADGDILYWSRGDEASIAVDARVRSGCRGEDAADPREAAALLGVDLRALGQEPGWSVEVMEGQWLRLVEAGRHGMRVAPEPTRESAGSGATVYTGRADGQRLRLRVTASACADPMSGESFPLTATLMLDGRELRGCARRLGASPDGG